MDRKTYVKIRSSTDLQRKSSVLPIYFLQNLGLLALGGSIWLLGKPYNLHWGVAPLLSVFIFRNFSMMHEAVHNAVSRKRWVNDIVGLFAGAFSLLPFEQWKRSHLDHHVWSGNIEKDPVTAFITVYPRMSKFNRDLLSFFWRIWFPMLGVVQYFVFWALASKQWIMGPRTFKKLVSLAVPFVIWAGAFVWAPVQLKIALGASILLYLIAVEIVNFPHHLQLPQYRGETKFPVWEQHRIARTCIYPRWFARFVVLNFNYHVEHHMFPDVPWYHLEQLHHKVREALLESYNVDPQFKWILENKKKSIAGVLEAAPLDSSRKAS